MKFWKFKTNRITSRVARKSLLTYLEEQNGPHVIRIFWVERMSGILCATILPSHHGILISFLKPPIIPGPKIDPWILQRRVRVPPWESVVRSPGARQAARRRPRCWSQGPRMIARWWGEGGGGWGGGGGGNGEGEGRGRMKRERGGVTLNYFCKKNSHRRTQGPSHITDRTLEDPKMKKGTRSLKIYKN